MTTNKRVNPSRRLFLSGCGLLVPLLTVLLLGAGDSDGPQLAKNRREIEQMTPAQRAQLDRNETVFQALTQEQQRRYRDLHRQLQTDENADALRVTLDRYRSWLKTLSPFDRETLRSMKDVDERVELVRQLKAQQSAPKPLSDEAPRLSREDLAAIMNVIAKELAIDSAKLASKTEWQRYMLILNGLVESKRGEIRFRDWTSIFDDGLMAKMTAALPEGEFREAIADVRRFSRFKSYERQIVARNIVESLGMELEKNLARKRPNAMQIKRASYRMNSDDRRRYEKLESQDEKDRFILRRYRVMTTYEVLKPYPALRPVFVPWLSVRHGGTLRSDSFSRRGGREPGRGGPDKKRPFGPAGPPRGFGPGEGKPRGDERPKRPK